MRDLVELAIEGHGGLAEWRKVSSVSANFSAWGPSLKARGPVGEAIIDKHMRVTVSTRKQEVTFDGFLGVGRKGIYQPHRTVVVDAEGATVEALDDPREALKHVALGAPWTGPQILYFLGYSLWLYFTLPYNFRLEGVACEEVAPWTEDGETWRRLKVTYPPSFPSHSTEQIHYFDEEGRMRRQDYIVDVRQNLGAVHYMYGQREFDGFIFPTQRRIYKAAPDGTPLKDEMLIAGDLGDYTITRTNVLRHAMA